MKRIKWLLLSMCLGLCACSSVESSVHTNDKGTQWKWEEGTIVVNTPVRPSGQKSVLGLALPKMEVVRVGFVGLGMRGPGAVERFTHIPGTQIVALCDYEEKRAEACQGYLKKASLPKAAIYSGEKGYEELCKRDDIDLVYVATDWMHHFPVAKCALENGKNVAIEVPSAMDLKECWELIDLSEKTRKHCMILENCCYDWFEMNTLNMAQQGVFGEVIRAQGAYIHNLEPFWKYYWKNGKEDKLGWRLDYNMRHRGDVYATHGLGPVAQALDIHRGDRMETLLGKEGAYLDAIYYCPHHPHKGYEGEVEELKIDCECRKPKPGMLLKAAGDFNIDLTRSWMIGDGENDIKAGNAAGCRTILIGDSNFGQDISAQNLYDAVNKCMDISEAKV